MRNILGSFWELGGTNREEAGKEEKIPPTPSQKGQKQAHQEGMRSLPISCRKFLFPKLWVTIIFLAYTYDLHTTLVVRGAGGCLIAKKAAWCGAVSP
jgi:hypothetical protein